MHNQHCMKDYLGLTLLGALLFLPFLGLAPLFDWDEINFAEAAREMLLGNEYSRVQINFRPFWEKPPLFIWMQALFMRLFGVNEFAARLPNAICGILTLNVMYYFGCLIKSRNLGLLWALLITGSILPHFYFQSGIIDPWFNLLIWISIFLLWKGLKWQNQSVIPFIISGLCLGLAVLVKGPVALIIGGLSMGLFMLLNRPEKKHLLPLFIGILTILVTSSSWFIIDILQNGTWFTSSFIEYQIRLFKTEDAGHGGPFYYHLIVVILGCFPASILAFGLWGKKLDPQSESFKTISLITVMVVLILFSVVKTKIIHYSSMTYIPLCGLAALFLEGKLAQKKILFTLVGMLGILWGATLLILVFMGIHPEWIQPFLAKDPFANKALHAKVHWDFYHFLPGILFILLSLGFLIFHNKSNLKQIQIYLLSQSIILSFSIILFAPQIEKYSQGAFIEFCKKYGKENIIEVYGFKSYGHYFYGSRLKSQSPLNYQEAMDSTWSKPVLVVSKIKRKGGLPDDGRLKEIKRENGYVFFEKK